MTGEPGKGKFCFTVFTPTYSRAHTLPLLFESLQKQTFRDFEWVVVDDGSVDGTDSLLDNWRREADFSIRYLWQENRGKHASFNVGVREARGAFFLPVGSDDVMMPHALERLKYWWDSLPEQELHTFCGIGVLSADANGNIIGDPYPLQVSDASFLEMSVRHSVSGDKWGFVLTEILREFPFPEIPGEKFIAEGIVWNRISLKYRMRFVNEPLQIVEYLSDGISASSLRIRMNNPRGARMYYLDFLMLPVPLIPKLRNLVNYIRFSFHASVPVSRLIGDSGHRFLALLLIPLGCLCYIRDRIVER